MTKICRKLKNVEITEDDDYEDNSDLSAQIVVKGIYI